MLEHRVRRLPVCRKWFSAEAIPRVASGFTPRALGDFGLAYRTALHSDPRSTPARRAKGPWAKVYGDSPAGTAVVQKLQRLQVASCRLEERFANGRLAVDL